MDAASQSVQARPYATSPPASTECRASRMHSDSLPQKDALDFIECAREKRPRSPLDVNHPRLHPAPPTIIPTPRIQRWHEIAIVVGDVSSALEIDHEWDWRVYARQIAFLQHVYDLYDEYVRPNLPRDVLR